MFANNINNPKDILVLPANVKGRDFIIADVHGNSACLANVIDELKLTDDDRLFIAGDLVDRGPDSEGVITLLQNKKNIYVIRGNHEFMTLDSIVAAEILVNELHDHYGEEEFRKQCKDFLAFITMIDDFSFKDEKAISFLTQHTVLNGGRWLLELFYNDLMAGRITILADKTFQYNTDSKIDKVRKYCHQLPYIYRVGGDNNTLPFCIVHSDMPISDKELSLRVASEQGLSLRERYYAVWARKSNYDNRAERDKNSEVAYCGHEVVMKHDVESVRQTTSHVNLDNASFLYNVAMVVNHTDGVVTCLGPDKKILDDPANEAAILLLQRTNEVKEYLETRRLDFALIKIKNKFITDILKTRDQKAFSERYKTVTDQLSRIIEEFNSARYDNFYDECTSFDLASYVMRSNSEADQKTIFMQQFKCMCKTEMLNDIKSMKHESDMESMFTLVLTNLNKLIEINNSYADCTKLPMYTMETLVQWVVENVCPPAYVSQTGLFSASLQQQNEKKCAALPENCLSPS